MCINSLTYIEIKCVIIFCPSCISELQVLITETGYHLVTSIPGINLTRFDRIAILSLRDSPIFKFSTLVNQPCW